MKNKIKVYLDFLGLIGILINPQILLFYILSEIILFNRSYKILIIIIPLIILSYRSLFTMFQLKKDYVKEDINIYGDRK